MAWPAQLAGPNELPVGRRSPAGHGLDRCVAAVSLPSFEATTGVVAVKPWVPPGAKVGTYESPKPPRKTVFLRNCHARPTLGWKLFRSRVCARRLSFEAKSSPPLSARPGTCSGLAPA